MRNIFWAGLGVLVFGISAAFADFDTYRFECHFMGSAAKATERCAVKARACEFLANGNETGVLERDCRDALFVECGGQVVFKGYAEHSSKHGFEFLKGKESRGNSSPAIKYVSEGNNKAHFTISAWLKLDEFELPGFCDVRAPRFD